jgi:hypothetical protein
LGDRPADDAGVRQSAGSVRHCGHSLIVNAIAADGETTWFEGVLLIGVYGLLGLAFFFVG